MPLKVIISGASSGLGSALARHYAGLGATLGLIARRADLLETLAAELSGCVDLCGRCPRCRRNASRSARFHASPWLSRYRHRQCRHQPRHAYRICRDRDVFERILTTNVIGMVNLFQPFVSAMRAAGQGSLVGIASVAGYRGLPEAALTQPPRLLPSAISKACESRCTVMAYRS